MAINRPAHDRTLWSLDELSRTELFALLDTAKALREAGVGQRPLRGKKLALLSARTKDRKPSEFQQAASDLGAHVAHVHADLPFGSDSAARLLGRLYDAIDCEGLDAATLNQIDREASVPVFNGLDGEAHPIRVLATLLGLQHRADRPLSGLSVAFLVDARTQRSDALLQGAALAGMEVRIGAPRAAWPDAQRLEQLRRIGRASGAKLSLTESPDAAADGADVVLDERSAAQAAASDDQRYVLQAVLLRALS
jgi:ornithine carbamoyltransferase